MVAFLALVAVLVAPAAPAHAITRSAAEAKALKALDVAKGNAPVIVFGQAEPIPAGAVITEAGDKAAHTGNKAGLRSIEAPIVMSNGTEPAYLFHEDRGPYQAFEHPGRVVLVERDSGEVRISRELSWVPMVGGEVLPWFATAGSYEKTTYRVFERGVGGIARSLRSARAKARKAQANATQLESRRRVGNALAAEKSCSLRVSDTLGNFFDYSGVDRSRARLGTLLEQMERLNAGFRSQRYAAASGRTPTAELERMIARSGCKDVLFYLAGSGYSSGAPAINVGTAPRGDDDVRLQDVSATQIERVMGAHRDVTFKIVIDAPYGGRVAERLRDEPNLAVLMSAGTANEPSYAYLPNVVAGGQLVRNTVNPTQLLEFTNRLVRGMEAFVDSPLEVDYALSQISAGNIPSMMVWMLARGLQLGTIGAPALPTPPVVILGGRFQPPAGPPFTPPGPPPVVPPGQAKKNVAPVADDSSAPVVEDTPTAVPLPASDADGDALTHAITEEPDHGSLSGTGAARIYTPDENFTGTDAFTYKVTDPSGASDTATVTLTVTAVDDDAEILASPGTVAYTENGAAVLVDDEVDISDVDSPTLSSATVAITGGFATGQDLLDFDEAADPSAITGEYDDATGVLVLSGSATVAQYQAALRSVRYENGSDAPSVAARTITFAAAGGSDTRGLALTEVNDGPVNSLPTAQGVEEDTLLGFNAGNGNLISVTDVDARSEAVEVSLDVDHGTLTLDGPSGLTFTSGDGSGDATMTFTGTVAAINAALDGMGYTPGTDYTGGDTLTIITDDQGNTGTGGALEAVDTVGITVGPVNDAPLNTVPGTQTLNEDASKALSGATALSVADLDAAGDELEVDLDVDHGTFDLGGTTGLDFTRGDGTDNDGMTFTGTIAEINAALDGLLYSPDADFAGADTLTIVTDDQGNNGSGGAKTDTDTVGLTVSPVNDAPVNTVPGAQTLNEDATKAISPSIADLDAAGDDVQVSLDVDHGVIDLPSTAGLTFDTGDADNTADMTFTGTVAAINTALDGLAYKPALDYNGGDTLTVVTSDLGNNGSGGALTDTDTVAFTVDAVNDAPVNTVPGAQTLNEDATKAISPSIADADAAGDDVQVSLDVDHGVIDLPSTAGLTFAAGDADETADMAFTGTVAAINAALDGLVYKPSLNANGADTLTIVTDDQGNNGSGGALTDTDTVAFTVAAVNDAPVNTVPGAQTLNEDATKAISPSIADLDAAGDDMQVRLDVDHGVLDLPTTSGLTFDTGDADDTGDMTFTGTVSAINTALDGLVYKPAADYNGADTFTIVTSDQGNNGSGGALTDTDTVGFTVGAVNDAPVMATGTTPATFTEGGSAVVVDPAVTASDIDSANLVSATVEITGNYANGTDALTFPNTADITGAWNAATGTLTLSGTDTVADYQAALRTVKFANSSENPSGSQRTVRFQVNDGSATSNLSNQPIIFSNVSPVNDAPVLTATAGDVAHTEDGAVTIVDSGLTISDVDSTTITDATVSIDNAEAGDVLAFADTAQITGTLDPSTRVLTLDGDATLAQYQAALRTVTYKTTDDTPAASRTIKFRVSDGGSTNNLSNVASRTVNVTAVNDAPVLGAGSGSTSYTEAGSPAAIAGALTVADGDSADLTGATVEITDGEQGTDVLGFTDTAKITTVSNANGLLTLTGAATLAEYQAALRSVTFSSSSGAPGTSREISFRVDDGAAPNNLSNIAKRTIAVTEINTAPVVTVTGGDTAHTEDAGATVVDGGLTVSDIDSATLTGATVSVLNAESTDVLAFSDTAQITGALDPATRTLTLSGSATLAQYQTALRTVTYRTTDDTPAAGRTIQFRVNDGAAQDNLSAIAGKGIAITPANDAPVLGAGTGSTSYTEAGAAAIIAGALTAADGDSPELTGATVEITDGEQGTDVLGFTDTAKITTVSNANGLLTLTGTATLAEYQAALRSVTFSSTSGAPGASREISFRVDDGAAANNLSAIAKRTIAITNVNTPPTIATNAAAATYTEDGAPLAIVPAFTVSDVDSTHLKEALVQLTSGGQTTDVLEFTAPAGSGITSTYNAQYNVLALSGVATLAQYQEAIRSVTFRTTSDNPSTANRFASILVTDNDAHGGADNSTSGNVLRSFGVARANDAPTVGTAAGSTTYTEAGAPAAIAPALTVTDPDSTDLTGATVEITGGEQGTDVLGFTDTAKITAASNANGLLTLTGTATLAEYQAALRSVTFSSTSGAPGATREISFRVNDGAAANNLSAIATKAIAITNVNTAPSVTTSGGSASFTEDGAAVAVDPALALSDVDSANLSGATVTITSAQTGDELLFNDPDGRITGSFSGNVLTLTGATTLANYQAALRTVQFDSTQDNPTSPRAITFRVDDGASGSNLSNVASRNVAISAVNDAPAIALPADQAVDEDATLALSGTKAITVSDVDANSGTVSVTLGTGNGTIAVDEPAGGTRTGSGTASATITGTVTAVNAALNSLVFTPTQNFNGSAPLSVLVDDGGSTGSGGAKTANASLPITVNAKPDAPQFTAGTDSTALAHSEGEGPEAILPAIELNDVDGGNLKKATVQVTDNYAGGEDELAFTNTANITGSAFDTATGTITLTGPATLAEFQSALRTVTYENRSDTPSTATRTITFVITDPTDLTASTTRTVAVTPTNDRPSVALSGSTPAYTEQTAAIAVDAGLDVTDPDDANLDSARVEVVDELAGDKLTFDAGSTGIANTSGDDHVLVLAKAGGASKADWQQVLRTVAFENQTDVVGSSRTIRFTVNDGDADSTDADKTVAVTDTPDRPIVTTGATLDYTEDDPATVIDATIEITDNDAIASARVSIPAPGYETDDDLAWTDNSLADGITLGSDDNTTDVLTLTGSGTLAEYEAALEAVTYEHLGEDPSGDPKTIAFEAADGDGYGDPSAVTVNVTPVNDAPVVTSGGTLSYTENGPATAIHSGLTITEPEGDVLSGASGSITANYAAGQDDLNWTDNDLADNITLDNVNTTDQTIVLTGMGTAAEYQAALRAITYTNTSENPSTSNRTVTFSATDQPGLTGSDTRTVAVTAVDDPPTAVNDAATVNEDAPATAIPVLTNDTDVDGGPKTISSATDPAKGTVVLTGGAAGAHTGLTYQPDPNYCNNPPGTTPDTFSYTVNGGSNATVSMTVTCVNDAPVADDETFTGNDSAHGNTAMIVNDPDDGAPTLTTPHTSISGNILHEDTDIDDPASQLTVTPGTFQTRRTATNLANGGSVTLEADGDFTVDPAEASNCNQGSMYFDYTVEDNSTLPDGEKTDTGRVTINVVGCVWYVHNQATGDHGTSTKPFDTIEDADLAAGANDSVFVYEGDQANVGTGYSGDGYQMASGERLIGEHEGLVVDQDHGTANNDYTADTLKAPSADDRPTLSASNADVISLDDNNEVRGFILDPDGTGGGIAGGSGDTGGATIDDIRVVDTDAIVGQEPAIELNSTTGTFAFTNLFINNRATGIKLHSTTTPANQVAATFPAATDVSITSNGGPAIDADGGTSKVNLANSVFDDLTVLNSTAGGVDLNNVTGPVTLGDGVGSEVALATTGGTSPALRVVGTDNVSIDGAGTDSLTATNSPALDASGVSGLALNLETLTSSGAPGSTDAVRLDNASGSVTGAAGSLSNAGGQDVDISGDDVSDNVDFTYNGTISDTAGTLVSIADQTGGTKDFNGAVGNPSGGGGVSIQSSAAAQTVRFDGGLTLSSGAANGLNASSGGTLAVTNQSGGVNTLAATTGTPLSVTNTTIHSDDLTFRSVASNGAANGIKLTNTGASGGLNVTGTGTQPTGGTITNSTGAGIDLDTVPGGVALDGVAVTNGGDDGVRASTVTGLTLHDSLVDSNGNGLNSGGNTPNEFGLDWLGVTGTAQIVNTTVEDSNDSNAHIRNTSGTTALTVTNSTFAESDWNTGLRLRGEGSSTMTAVVTGSTFARNADVGFSMQTDSSAPSVVQTLTFDNNDVSGGHPTNPVSARPNISINVDGSSDVQATITDNDIKSAAGAEMILNTLASSTSAARFDAVVSGNDIGDAQPGNLDALADGGPGIWGWQHGDGIARLDIHNNTVQNWGVRGLELGHNDGNGTADYTVTNNVLSNPDQTNNTYDGMFMYSGGLAGDQSNVCVDLRNNDFDGIGRQGVSDLAIDRFKALNPNARLRFAGVNSDVIGTLQSQLRAFNPLSPALTVETFSNTQDATAATSCTTSQGTPVNP